MIFLHFPLRSMWRFFYRFGSVRVRHSMKSQIRKVSATSEKHCWLKWSSQYCFRSKAIRSLLWWNGGTWWGTVAAKGEGQNRYDLITRNRSGMNGGLCEITTWRAAPSPVRGGKFSDSLIQKEKCSYFTLSPLLLTSEMWNFQLCKIIQKCWLNKILQILCRPVKQSKYKNMRKPITTLPPDVP